MQSDASAFSVELGEAARTKILELATATGAQGRAVRIYAEARGSGGPLYGMSFDDPAPSDVQLETQGLTLLVDLESLAWVSGLRIDYRGAPSGFIFSFPAGVSDRAPAEAPVAAERHQGRVAEISLR